MFKKLIVVFILFFCFNLKLMEYSFEDLKKNRFFGIDNYVEFLNKNEKLQKDDIGEIENILKEVKELKVKQINDKKKYEELEKTLANQLDEVKKQLEKDYLDEQKLLMALDGLDQEIDVTDSKLIKNEKEERIKKKVDFYSYEQFLFDLYNSLNNLTEEKINKYKNNSIRLLKFNWSENQAFIENYKKFFYFFYDFQNEAISEMFSADFFEVKNEKNQIQGYLLFKKFKKAKILKFIFKPVFDSSVDLIDKKFMQDLFNNILMLCDSGPKEFEFFELQFEYINSLRTNEIIYLKEEEEEKFIPKAKYLFFGIDEFFKENINFQNDYKILFMNKNYLMVELKNIEIGEKFFIEKLLKDEKNIKNFKKLFNFKNKTLLLLNNKKKIRRTVKNFDKYSLEGKGFSIFCDYVYKNKQLKDLYNSFLSFKGVINDKKGNKKDINNYLVSKIESYL